MRKAHTEKKGVWIAILEWLDAPTPGSTSSPAQRLMSRRIRSLLPCINEILKPEVQPHITEQLISKRRITKQYQYRNAKTPTSYPGSKPLLHIGQPVRVKTHPQQPHSDLRDGNVVRSRRAKVLKK